MPLNMHESKKLIVGMFRLALAASERRSEDAVKAFSEILDTTIVDSPQQKPWTCHPYQPSRFDIDAASSVSDSSSMPELVPLSTVHNYLRTMNVQQEQEQADDAVKLVISETEEQKPLDSNHPVNTRIDSASNTTVVLAAPEQKEEEAEDDEEAEEEAEDDDEVEEEQEEDVEEGETEEEEQEEENEELQLIPVRIKKVTYWKDELTGDIYQYLPNDECGHKVGTYIDDKPVFN